MSTKIATCAPLDNSHAGYCANNLVLRYVCPGSQPDNEIAPRRSLPRRGWRPPGHSALGHANRPVTGRAFLSAIDDFTGRVHRGDDVEISLPKAWRQVPAQGQRLAVLIGQRPGRAHLAYHLAALGRGRDHPDWNTRRNHVVTGICHGDAYPDI